jgi:hypothetical protein
MLSQMNRSELVQVARAAGMGNISRDNSRSDLVRVICEEDGLPEDALQERRRAIQAHIAKHKNRLLSQLPGCDGRCTTYGCPDIIVTRCWAGFSRDML